MKKILSILIVIILSFNLIACSEKESIKERDFSNLEAGKYVIEKEGSSVYLITNDGVGIQTTEYKFENNILSSATVTHKYKDESTATNAYTNMQSNKTLTEQYINIKQDKDTITMEIKSDLLNTFGSIDPDTFLNSMKQTYKNQLAN